jgi:hypothetical protein
MKLFISLFSLILSLSSFAGTLTNKETHERITIEKINEDEIRASGYEPLEGKILSATILKKVTDEYKANGSLFPVFKMGIVDPGCHDRNGTKVKCKFSDNLNPLGLIFLTQMTIVFGTMDAVALPFRIVNRTVGNGKTRRDQANSLIDVALNDGDKEVNKKTFERMIVLLSRSLKL